MPNESILALYVRLFGHLNTGRRVQIGLLLFLMLLASMAEILSIGSVLPFLGVLTAPEKVFSNNAITPVINYFKLTQPEQLIFPITFVFCVAALLAGSTRLLLLWANTRLSFDIGADLSIEIYQRTLYQPYAVHCARNSSEVISGITNKTNNVIGYTIVPALTLISSCVMLFSIVIALFAVEPSIALTAMCGFSLIYLIIILVTRKRLFVYSNLISRESTHAIKSLQEGLGGIRDVLIDGSQKIYCQIYRKSDLPLRRAQGSHLFITQSPRYAMEAFGMMLIAVLAYTLACEGDGVANAIPRLGMIVLGAQRLLPVLQQAYAAWISIRVGQVSLMDTIQLLDQQLPDYFDKPKALPLSFRYQIELKEVSYLYDIKESLVLKKISLSIPKGSRVGFIGKTGSGKSTLLDVVMGLLMSTTGSIEIDGHTVTLNNIRSWQAHIAHVPQVIFLADSTIEENIAFGIPKDQINKERVRQAAQQAQIAENIEAFPERYQTFVGERGIRLSGGQRQRIGIARALYRQADVIIFDEATSALDNETEEAVMQAINGLGNNLTLLIVAHRLTTLKNCTKIVELSNGSIINIGGYDEIISKKR